MPSSWQKTDYKDKENNEKVEGYMLLLGADQIISMNYHRGHG